MVVKSVSPHHLYAFLRQFSLLSVRDKCGAELSLLLVHTLKLKIMGSMVCGSRVFLIDSSSYEGPGHCFLFPIASEIIQTELNFYRFGNKCSFTAF